MSEHDALRELSGPYALGLLDADERRVFELHLPLCEICRQEVADARLVAEALGRAVDPVDPPAAMKGRVLAAATAGRQMPARRTAVTPSTFPWWLAAVASVTAIVCGLGWWSSADRLDRAQAALQSARQELALAESRRTSAESVSDRTTHRLAIVAASDAVRVDLKGQAPAPAAAGRVYWSRSRGVTFTASNLPPVAAGRVYQLWFVTAGSPVSAGLIAPDAGGSSDAVLPSPAGVEPTAFALTIEPAGGSPGPTGAMLLVGAR